MIDVQRQLFARSEVRFTPPANTNVPIIDVRPRSE